MPSGELLAEMEELSESIHDKIEGVDATLNTHQAMHEMRQKECTNCGRRHPAAAKMCHPCYNTQLRQRYCTAETRVSEYIAALRRAELWGDKRRSDALSNAELKTRMSHAYYGLRHYCEPRCLLQAMVFNAFKGVESELSSVDGIRLEDIPRGSSKDD